MESEEPQEDHCIEDWFNNPQSWFSVVLGNIVAFWILMLLFPTPWHLLSLGISLGAAIMGIIVSSKGK